MLDQKKEQLSKLSKRKFIVGGAAVAASTQVKWVEPIVNSVILPAHAQTSVAATYSLAYAEIAPSSGRSCTHVYTNTRFPAPGFGFSGTGGTGEYTQDRLVTFTLTNNSTVAVSLAPITFPAPAPATLTITRTDAALATPIPVGAVATFDAVLDEGTLVGTPDAVDASGIIGINALNTPFDCLTAVPTGSIDDQQPVLQTDVAITIMINEDPAPINQTLTFAAV